MVFLVNPSAFNSVTDDLPDSASCFNKLNWVFAFSDGSFAPLSVSSTMLMLVLSGHSPCLNAAGSAV